MNLAAPLKRLNQLIDWSYEYSEAEYQVLCEFRLNDRQMTQLRELYDLQ
jgi:hypothetical protein